MKDLTDYRRNYQAKSLLDEDVEACPFAQFSKWFDEVDTLEHRKFLEPNAMTLCTVDRSLQPKSRVVLLKKMDEQGFIFFTNYQSEKAHNIAQNDRVSLTFFWHILERQVHIQGRAQKVSSQESDRYFGMRPRESQLAACISPQSQPIRRGELYERYENFKKSAAKQAAAPISRPYFWGGYRVIPHSFEYWQGGNSRLHDRITYTKICHEVWDRKRIAP